MRHGSLESGLGGFDYAAEQIGWENIFHVEINKFCQTILKYYWPNAKSYTDIFEFDGTEWRGKVDIITAGFPCQPFSHAGKRKGSSDDRHLWPENMRIFREAKPRWIICENVPGLLTIESGMVFEQVCADLENEGYETQAFIIPAVAKDAVHRRDRIWIVAHSASIRWNNGSDNREKRHIQTNERALTSHNSEQGFIADNHAGQHKQSKEQICAGRGTFNSSDRDAADNSEQRFQRSVETNRGEGKKHNDKLIDGCDRERESWLEAATRLCSVDDELAATLDTAAISKSKWRTESIKAYGNAIYWPIAYELFKAIELYETISQH